MLIMHEFSVVYQLVELLQNGGQGQLVLEGEAKLSLPVSFLAKLNTVLQQFDDTTIKLTTTDENKLQHDISYLKKFVSKTPKLKLSYFKGPLPTEIDITRFANLRYIELVHVNVNLIKGLQVLRPQLELLVCSSSTNSFEDILAGDSDLLQVWEELRTVDLSCNKIELLGNTFLSTPWIQYLDLSSNKLSDVEGSLECLKYLKYLNLSYNHLDSLPFLSQECCRSLEVLLLSHNLIEDISGIWLFNNISRLDLSHNLLEDHVGISSLVELGKLQWLNFTGNPFSYHRYHRTYTCAYLSKSVSVQSLILDNKKLSSNERKVVGTRSRRIDQSSYVGHGINTVGNHMTSSTSHTNKLNTVMSNIESQNITDRNEPINSDIGIKAVENIAGGSNVVHDDKPGSFSLSRSTSSSGRKMPKIREAIIVDADEIVLPPTPVLQKDGGEHLETKKQVEVLRQRFGEDHWLHSHAGSFVQDLLGLQKTPGPATVLEEEEKTPKVVPVGIEKHEQLETITTDQKLQKSTNCNYDDDMKNSAVSQTAILTNLCASSIKNETSALSSVFSKSDDNLENDCNSSFNNKNINSSTNELKSLTDKDLGNLTCDNATDNYNMGYSASASDQDYGELLTSRNVQDDYSVNDGDDDEDDDEDDDDDNDDDNAHPWLVQKVVPGKKDMEEIFLVLKVRELIERSPLNGRTLVRWGLSTLQSCVKISATPPIVQLTFDTVRRSCQQRTYQMEPPDSQELLRRLGEILESRPLSAMKQSVFRCMKCSALFSRELKATILNPDGASDLCCEVCRSTLVVKVNEDDEIERLPSISKSGVMNPATFISTSTADIFTSSSVITVTTNNNNSGSYPGSAVQSKLSASPSQCSIGSAASLDQSSSRESPAAGLGDSNILMAGTQSVKCDSDIEIISNPSQSSIEVLEVQARLQGSNTPNRKRSSEERQTVAVPQLMTVPEVTNNLAVSNITSNTVVLLTESSSSGSLTDSICTAYENHPPLSSSRRLPSQGSVTDKLIEETTAVDSPDNKSSVVITSAVQSSSGTNYGNMLQGLFRSVTSKLESPTLTTIDSRHLNNSDLVHYNYCDFSYIDHRIKLYLYQQLFKNDDEQLILLLKADVIEQNNTSYPGCLVISTHSCFLLKVTGKECGDDASNFLEKVLSVPLAKAQLSRISWDQGVKVNVDQNLGFLLVLHDVKRTNDFFKFISDSSFQLPVSDQLKVIDDELTLSSATVPYVNTDHYMILQNVLSANCHIKDSNNICTLFITCSITIKRDNESDVVLPLSCIASTGCELFILTSDLRWLLKEDEIPVIYTVHNIMNLMDAQVVNGCQLTLHFLDETKGIEEAWMLTFITLSPIDSVVDSIKKPWEAIYSVPLQVTQFNDE
ncbi:uncharacterized protein LOC142329667 isoform X3 [Lycorma delicatula]|uniref:uncharacterized protein LOC142329667 isoform X3 n=1 Tax=Lycorma delicatula TaxID=130591 RepID=UPI003F517697